MRAIVRSLEERTLLDVRPGRTADEAASEAGHTLPSRTNRLRAAARDFDDVTYGGRRATEQSYHRIAELNRDLERTRPQLAHSSESTAPQSPPGNRRMTTEATLPSTSASPTARQMWTRARGILFALLLLLAGAVTIAVLRSGAEYGRLDPRSADPSGSRAVATLLTDHGVSTRVVTTLDEARTAADPDTTLALKAAGRL